MMQQISRWAGAVLVFFGLAASVLAFGRRRGESRGRFCRGGVSKRRCRGALRG